MTIAQTRGFGNRHLNWGLCSAGLSRPRQTQPATQARDALGTHRPTVPPRRTEVLSAADNPARRKLYRNLQRRDCKTWEKPTRLYTTLLGSSCWESGPAMEPSGPPQGNRAGALATPLSLTPRTKMLRRELSQDGKALAVHLPPVRRIASRRGSSRRHSHGPLECKYQALATHGQGPYLAAASAHLYKMPSHCN